MFTGANNIFDFLKRLEVKFDNIERKVDETNEEMKILKEKVEVMEGTLTHGNSASSIAANGVQRILHKVELYIILTLSQTFVYINLQVQNMETSAVEMKQITEECGKGMQRVLTRLPPSPSEIFLIRCGTFIFIISEIHYSFATERRVNNVDKFNNGQQSLHKFVLDLDALVSSDSDRLKLVDDRVEKDMVMWVIDVSSVMLLFSTFENVSLLDKFSYFFRQHADVDFTVSKVICDRDRRNAGDL